MNNMIVAEGNSVVSMTAMFVGAIVNILLDPILIFALDMGVFGAGMATLIARMVSSVIYIFYVCKKESIMSLNPMDVRFQANFFKSILAAGLPVALFQLVSGAGQTVLNYLAGGYGVDAQAAIGIVNKVMFLELNLLYGFFKGYSPVVGYNYGAGKQERVKEATRLALTWSTGATFLCGCFL